MNEFSRKLKKKYLTTWTIAGAIFGFVAVLATGNNIGTVILATLIGGPGAMFVLAGMGFFIEGLTKYNWRFGEIEHQPWIWHIYPILGGFLFVLGFGALAFSIVTLGKFGR